MPKRLDQKRWELKLKDNWLREKIHQGRGEAADDRSHDEYRSHYFGISDNLVDEFDQQYFYSVCEFFCALQHAYEHGDIGAFLRISGDDDYQNYTLRIANELILGRKFVRKAGKIFIEKTGKMAFNEEKIRQVHRAMTNSFDPEFDELPQLLPRMSKLLES